MPFTKTQYFYAALFALAALPDGERVATEKILPRFRMKRPDFAVLQPLAAGQQEDPENDGPRIRFFNALHRYLRNGGAPGVNVFDSTGNGTFAPDYTFTGRRQISLRNTASWSNGPHQRCPEGRPDSGERFFTPPLEYAVNVSGIKRSDVGGSVRLNLQDDGQILAWIRKDGGTAFETVSLNYPGRPKPAFRHVTLSREDFGHCRQAALEETFRVVPVAPERELTWIYTSVAGKACKIKYIKFKGDDIVALLRKANLKAGDITAPGDEDIIGATGPVLRNEFGDAAEYAPGYTDSDTGSRVEGTDKPGIVRRISAPCPVMDVAEPVQFTHAGTLVTARPGDVILWDDYYSQPHVIEKSALARGCLTLTPFAPTGSQLI